MKHRLISLIKDRRPQLDDRLGRLIYGNLSPFSYNREGQIKLEKQRASPRRKLSPEGRSFIESMKLYGFYRVPFSVPPGTLAPIVQAYQAAITDPERSDAVMSLRAQEAGLSTFCRSVTAEQLPELENLLTPQIMGLVDEFYNGAQQRLLAGARRNLHIPPDIAREYDIYSNSWHCDREPTERIKLFIALSDIDAECGPFHLLPRRRTREILQMGFINRDNYGIDISEIEDPNYLELFTGPAGSAMFANVTQCLHKAGVPAPGKYRDIAEFQFSLQPVSASI